MSRRNAGAAARQEARHARDRLQSTLGTGGLLTDGSGKVFEYDGGGHDPAGDASPGPAAESHAGDGRSGPALRWRLGLRVALLISTLAVLGGAWFWMQVAAGQPEVTPLSDVSSLGGGETVEGAHEQEPQGAGPPASPLASQETGILIVHVAGAVAVPGIVQLPVGSRVHQAVAAAGGGTPSADLNRLNLAAVLTDGQKLYVPQAGEEIPGGVSGSVGQTEVDGGGTAAAGGKVNLNTAGVEELDSLPKVGPVLAQRIVDWRKENGPFKSVEELDAVDGVGPKMLETLLPLVSV